MEYLFRAALAGNPNCGKSTLFNALTGARQHVGNYPGITVEKKEGAAKLPDGKALIIDLPGTYSLTAYSPEEIVARTVLADKRPDVVINVLDCGSLARNLYLTVQLLEMGLPVVLALNMLDELPGLGLDVDIDKLASLLGLPVAGTVARNGQGVQKVLELARGEASARKGSVWQPLKISYGSDLDPVLAEMEALIEAEAFLTERFPARWAAIKYLEADAEMLEVGRAFNPAVAARLEEGLARVSKHLKDTLNTYPEAVIADYRYGFISALLRQGVLKEKDDIKKRVSFSDKADALLTHRFFGPLFMLGVIYLIYKITFTLGEAPTDYLEGFFGWLAELVSAHLPEGQLRSLLVDGVIGGVGGVVGFVPLIVVIFIMVAVLEDSGYMARMAYMLDRIFRAFGLHGNSVMPFIISGGIAGGCAVPGVMAARTLRSRKEKLATMLTAPFFACGAKLPVFLLLCSVFFPSHADLIMFFITILAWALALLMARLLRSTLLKGESTPFIMELPPYRWPTLRGVLLHMWERTFAYLKKAGTIILAVAIVIWAALTYPGLSEEQELAFEQKRQAVQTMQSEAAQLRGAVQKYEEELQNLAAQKSLAELQNSYAGRLGMALEPASRLAGFDWRTNIALIGGFAAKEVVVSSLGTAYALGETDLESTATLEARIKGDKHWNVAVAISLMLFVLIYAPCFATLAVIKQESGSWGWTVFSSLYTTALAFGVSVVAYQALSRLLV